MLRKYKGNIKEIRRKSKGNPKEMPRKYNGNRKCRGNTKEIQRKYKGTTKEIQRKHKGNTNRDVCAALEPGAGREGPPRGPGTSRVGVPRRGERLGWK